MAALLLLAGQIMTQPKAVQEIYHHRHRKFVRTTEKKSNETFIFVSLSELKCIEWVCMLLKVHFIYVDNLISTNIFACQKTNKKKIRICQTKARRPKKVNLYKTIHSLYLLPVDDRQKIDGFWYNFAISQELSIKCNRIMCQN